jgi:hypothetical protein
MADVVVAALLFLFSYGTALGAFALLQATTPWRSK